MILHYGKYDFSCVFEENALLPKYKGSTFRGVFGHALKRIVCALRRQICDDRLLRQTCVHAFVFEGIHDENSAPLRKRVAAPPNAYVIRWWAENHERLSDDSGPDVWQAS
jgi:hypothetical protein